VVPLNLVAEVWELNEAMEEGNNTFCSVVVIIIIIIIIIFIIILMTLP
jgi:hypothetical protein